ncbi:MAG: hypothetical protein H0V45_07390 [Actinobacteria bacterium]|nr:hypothetical protein [Actinomycetota bacterium]
MAGSLAANSKLADRLFVGSPGFCVIAAFGPTVSIVHVKIVSGPVLLAASVALTAKVCVPSERLL